jgi:hypothetical protein
MAHIPSPLEQLPCSFAPSVEVEEEDQVDVVPLAQPAEVAQVEPMADTLTH